MFPLSHAKSKLPCLPRRDEAVTPFIEYQVLAFVDFTLPALEFAPRRVSQFCPGNENFRKTNAFEFLHHPPNPFLLTLLRPYTLLL